MKMFCEIEHSYSQIGELFRNLIHWQWKNLVKECVEASIAFTGISTEIHNDLIKHVSITINAKIMK